MRLPHTDSAEAIWAFKKGYRFAEQGKPLNDMPVTVRAQPWLRDYFMQGYEQAQAELVPARGDGLTPRKRIIWLLFAALAGVGTAWLMIQQIQADKRAEPVQLAANTAKDTQPTQKAVKTAPAPARSNPTASPKKIAAEKVGDPPSDASTSPIAPVLPPSQTPSHPTLPRGTADATSSDDTAPGLLDAEARAKQQSALDPAHARCLTPLPPSNSPIRIERSTLAQAIVKRVPQHPFDTTVPRTVRKVYFFTHVKNGEGHILRHRWYFGNQLKADVPLPIHTHSYRTWSSKRLSPAESGLWCVEAVDETGQIIARTAFQYGHM